MNIKFLPINLFYKIQAQREDKLIFKNESNQEIILKKNICNAKKKSLVSGHRSASKSVR